MCDTNNYFLIHLHIERNVQAQSCVTVHSFPSQTLLQKVLIFVEMAEALIQILSVMACTHIHREFTSTTR